MFDFLKKKAQDAPPPELPQGTVRRHYVIRGQVQGVGFRFRAQCAADALGLTGWVENEPDGTVELEVQGQPEQFAQLFAMIAQGRYVEIDGMTERDCPPDPWERSFRVRGY